MSQRGEVALQVHPHDVVELGLRHVGEHAVAQDAGVVHEDVQVAKGVERGLHQPFRTGPVGDVVGVGDRLATEGADLVDDLLRGPGVGATAVGSAAQVVHHDVGAFTRRTAGRAPGRSRVRRR